MLKIENAFYTTMASQEKAGFFWLSCSKLHIYGNLLQRRREYGTIATVVKYSNRHRQQLVTSYSGTKSFQIHRRLKRVPMIWNEVLVYSCLHSLTWNITAASAFNGLGGGNWKIWGGCGCCGWKLAAGVLAAEEAATNAANSAAEAGGGAWEGGGAIGNGVVSAALLRQLVLKLKEFTEAKKASRIIFRRNVNIC